MEPRFNMFDNEIGARFGKRFANASMVIVQSPLPKSTQELVGLRASQINGCGWCVDLHTKGAAAVDLAGAQPDQFLCGLRQRRLRDHHAGVGEPLAELGADLVVEHAESGFHDFVLPRGPVLLTEHEMPAARSL